MQHCRAMFASSLFVTAILLWWLCSRSTTVRSWISLKIRIFAVSYTALMCTARWLLVLSSSKMSLSLLFLDSDWLTHVDAHNRKLSVQTFHVKHLSHNESEPKNNWQTKFRCLHACMLHSAPKELLHCTCVLCHHHIIVCVLLEAEQWQQPIMLSHCGSSQLLCWLVRPQLKGRLACVWMWHCLFLHCDSLRNRSMDSTNHWQNFCWWTTKEDDIVNACLLNSL